MFQYLLLRDEHYVVADTNRLVLNLSPDTTLTVHRGFFHNNKVQRFQISGGKQFELASDAMEGNRNAPFPEIEIVGCESVVFGTKAFYGEFELNVTNTRSVIVFEEAFKNTGFKAHFMCIGDLRIHVKAFSGAHTNSKLHVYNSKLDDLEPLHASLREIRFVETRIEKIEAQAFDVTELNAIDFWACNIGLIKANAFTDKVKRERNTNNNN